MARLPFWSNAQVVQQLDSGLHLTGTQWTLAFPTSNTWIPAHQQEHAGFAALNTAQQSAAKLAMQVWDDLITPNTTFNGSNTSSTILVSNNTGTSDYSYAYYPDQQDRMGSTAWINPTYSELAAPKVGDYSFLTYLHELGHTLGLDHMGNYNGTANWPTDASSVQDSHLYSVMSYFAVWETGQAKWTVGGIDYYAQTPMVNDILAIQSIYGADPITRATGTTYGFHAAGLSSATNQIYDFNVNKHPILTIYDAGGNDTLDLSSYSSASKVDLNAGHFSSAAGMTNNIGIALNTTLENAVGGAGNDVIIGNSADNVLSGGLGNDRIEGGAGNDKLDGGVGVDVMIGGGGSDIYVVDNALDIIVETANSGIDTVQSSTSFALGANVEKLTLTGPAALVGNGNQLDNTIIANDGGDRLFGWGGNDKLYGGSGADFLIGGDGNDWLHGGLGIDTLSGGWGSDVFDFTLQPSGRVQDTITDFMARGAQHDFIQIDRTLAPDFDYLVSHHALSQVGANTVLTLGTNEMIKLIGVDSHQLTSADFLFV